MFKSMTLSAAAITLGVAAWLLLPLRGHEVAAQSGPYFINVVDLDIKPANLDQFIAAIKENGAATAKEEGVREFNITVSQKDPNHILLFEAYNSAAALDAHRATDHFKKFIATTKDMVAKREIRQFSSIAMNMHGM